MACIALVVGSIRSKSVHELLERMFPGAYVFSIQQNNIVPIGAALLALRAFHAFPLE